MLRSSNWCTRHLRIAPGFSSMQQQRCARRAASRVQAAASRAARACGGRAGRAVAADLAQDRDGTLRSAGAFRGQHDRGRAACRPYRLLRQIGEAGTASVWLAERTDLLHGRRVALKLPHGAWRGAAWVARLARAARRRPACALAARGAPSIDRRNFAHAGGGASLRRRARSREADEFWRGFDAESRWAGEAAYWLGRCQAALGRRPAGACARRTRCGTFATARSGGAQRRPAEPK